MEASGDMDSGSHNGRLIMAYFKTWNKILAFLSSKWIFSIYFIVARILDKKNVTGDVYEDFS